MAELDATLIFFESPRRVLATLGDVEAVLGDRRMVAAREVSKIHEEFIRGHVSEVRQRLGNPLGEFTILVEGRQEKAIRDDGEAVAAAQRWAQSASISTRDLAQRLQNEYGLSRRRAYAIATGAWAGES